VCRHRFVTFHIFKIKFWHLLEINF
jgi:hypothetical protein